MKYLPKEFQTNELVMPPQTILTEHTLSILRFGANLLTKRNLFNFNVTGQQLIVSSDYGRR